jgi:hypothetical protein
LIFDLSPAVRGSFFCGPHCLLPHDHTLPSCSSASLTDVDSSTEAAMTVAARSKADRIRELNDAFRRSFAGGHVVLTAGINALSEDVRAQVLAAVRTFEDFNDDNDPHREHDFLSVTICENQIFAKIDYYDRATQFGSDDPSNPERTIRVLTVMLASEY